MKKSLIFTLLASLLGLATCLAQNDVVSRVSIRKHREYARLPEALKELVAQKAKAGRNTFYACRVEQFSNGYHHAWIYWREDNSIILVEPDHGAYDRKYLLLWSRRYLHLDKDVLPTVDDVGGSNYLVTREWAHSTIDECMHHGDRFVVEKPERNRRSAQSNNHLDRSGIGRRSPTTSAIRACPPPGQL